MIEVLKAYLKRKLALIPAMQFRQSFAVNDLDKKIEPFVGRKRGTFIEAGANNGLSQSNSLYFERYFGWTGLLVEPVPCLAAECRRNRQTCIVENVALVDRHYPKDTIEITYCGLMSSTQGAFATSEERTRHIERGRKFLGDAVQVYDAVVPASTLSSLLDKHGIIDVDLLTLDVEGYELQAIGGLDLARHRPKFLLIEVRHCQREAIESRICPYYQPVAVLSFVKDYSDILYQREES